MHRYPTGRAWFTAILDAIERAHSSVDVEFYTWIPGQLADRIGAALIRAVGRGCRVRLLLDAFGSEGARPTIGGLTTAGIEFAWFNPRRLIRLSFRNHRKLVIIDADHAFLGGCNVADDYDGDGVEQGWRDLGVCVHERVCAASLARSFEQMWKLAPFDHLPTAATMPQAARGEDWELFFAGAGRGGRRYRRGLHRDLARARNIDVLAAYFVPTTRIRKLLAGVARRGQVRVIVPAAGDIALAQLSVRFFPFSEATPITAQSGGVSRNPRKFRHPAVQLLPPAASVRKEILQRTPLTYAVARTCEVRGKSCK